MRIPRENYANAFVSRQGKVFTVDRSASKDYVLNGRSMSRLNRKHCERYRDDSTREKLLEDFLNTRDYVKNNLSQLLNCNLTHLHRGST